MASTATILRHQSVVDWIALEVQTATPTNAQTVRRALRRALGLPENAKLFAEPLQPGEGGATIRFQFRIQNPRSGRHVAEAVERLPRYLPVNTVLTSCKVTAIEVALDSYAPGASARQLAEIVADRYRFSTQAPADTWHLYRRKGERPCVIQNDMLRWELLRHLEGGWQLADTPDKGAAVRFHAYVKTHDHDGEQFRALPQSEWRGRFEVTLQGAALPITTLADLERFDFSELAEYFKFRRLADHLHPAAKHALAQCSTVQLGRRGHYRRRDKRSVGRYSGTSVFRASTVADDQLNATAYECLRKLTRGWVGKGASADFPGESALETRVDAENIPSNLTMYLSTSTASTSTPTHSQNSHNRLNNEAHSADCLSGNINPLDVLRTSPLPDARLEHDAHRARIESLMTLGSDDEDP